MTRLAKLHNAVNLSQGFPDFRGAAGRSRTRPARAIQRRAESVRAVHAARRRCARRLPRDFSRRYGVPVVADEQVTVCCGSTEAMMATMLAMHRSGRRGDRLRAVLRELRPRRDPVRARRRRYVTLREPDWRFDPDELAAAFIEQHARDHHQHAEQPDRQGVHARRAAG